MLLPGLSSLAFVLLVAGDMKVLFVFQLLSTGSSKNSTKGSFHPTSHDDGTHVYILKMVHVFKTRKLVLVHHEPVELIHFSPFKDKNENSCIHLCVRMCVPGRVLSRGVTLTYVLDKYSRPPNGSRLEGACWRLLAGDAEGLRAVVMEMVGGAAE